MSKVVTTTVAPTQPGDTVTLGGTGDSVVITNNDIRTNVLQDAGGNAIFTSDGSGTLSGLNSGLSGDAWKLLNTTNASNVANVTFTSLSSYKIYKFEFFDVVPVTDGDELAVDGSVGGSFGVTKTTNRFYAQHNESGSTSGLHYSTGGDLAESTSVQMLTTNLGNGADECGTGELFLFNPASTTQIKHFISRFQVYHSSDFSVNTFVGGYFDTTSAIDGIRYTMTSGNISVATIKQYGLVAL